MGEIISEEEEQIQNRIRAYLIKHIKKELADITWEEDGLYVCFNDI